ncbi:MAG TPA: flagellar FlbD family protein [Verrucomicrobiae bacterium]|nr:flagellar FlbD family protein [Verrucomicrobiae bacterium]
MITVTRLNHSQIVLNSDLIEQIEPTPDTVISLTTGQRIIVRESTEEILQRIVDFRRSIVHSPPDHLVRSDSDGTEPRGKLPGSGNGRQG